MMTRTQLDDRSLRPARCTPVLVIGGHGGAGTTTLVGQLGPQAREAGRIGPAVEDVVGSAVIVVVRGTAAGAGHAVDAVGRLRAAGAATVVVAAVGDGPWPEPLAARARLRALAGHVPVVRIPYVARWRFEDVPSSVPACYERAVTRLRAAYCGCTDHHDQRATA